MAFEMQNAFLHFTRITHAQKSKFGDFWTIKHPTTLGFWFFIIFFFSLSPFLFLLSFCCSCWPSARPLLSSRISKKALTRQEILAMERGNFPMSFLLKFQNILVHIQAPSTQLGRFRYHWKGLVLLHNLSINDAFLDQR